MQMVADFRQQALIDEFDRKQDRRRGIAEGDLGCRSRRRPRRRRRAGRGSAERQPCCAQDGQDPGSVNSRCGHRRDAARQRAQGGRAEARCSVRVPPADRCSRRDRRLARECVYLMRSSGSTIDDDVVMEVREPLADAALDPFRIVIVADCLRRRHRCPARFLS